MLMTGKISYPSWLFLLFAATLALGTDEFVISGILPAIASDLGTTTGHVGLLVTAFALAFCIASPVIAVATDRYDKKKDPSWRTTYIRDRQWVNGCGK